MRMTTVLRHVDGNWGIVQGHLSGAANINQDLLTERQQYGSLDGTA